MLGGRLSFEAGVGERQLAVVCSGGRDRPARRHSWTRYPVRTG